MNSVRYTEYIFIEDVSSFSKVFASETMAKQYRFLGHQLSLMRMIGLWPLETKFRPVHWLVRVFFYVEMGTLFLCTLGLLGATLFSDDLKQISSTMDILTLTASALYKMSFMSLYNARFIKLVDSMDSTFKLLLYNGQKEFFSVECESRKCAFYSNAFVLSGMVTMVFYSLIPLFEEGAFVRTVYDNSTGTYTKIQYYPLQFWSPFRSDSTVAYVCFYLIQGCGMVFSAVIYLVNDAFLFMMIYQLALQMRALNLTLMNLGQEDADFHMDCDRLPKFVEGVQAADTTPRTALTPKAWTKIEFDDELYTCSTTKVHFTCKKISLAKLGSCIKFHSSLLSMMIEMEKLYRSMILADVMHAIISLSFALFDTGTSDSIYESITKNMFLVICILHQFLNSYYGEMFLEAQTDVGKAIYMSDWVDQDVKYCKHLIMILARSKQCTVLNGGKLYHLCRPSFVLFLKSMFSYYMVLRNSSEGQDQIV